MKKLTLKIGFLLTAAETAFLGGLTPNSPDAKLSTVDARAISNIYYRVLGAHPKFDELVTIAKKRQWPGGERKTTLQAQRDVLNLLIDLRAQTPLIDEQPLDLLVGTLQYGDPLQVALAGAALHVIEVKVDDVPEVQPPSPDVITMVVNGSFKNMIFNQQLSHKQVFSMAFPDQPYNDAAVCTVKCNKIPGYNVECPDTTLGNTDADFICAYPHLQVVITNSTPVQA